MAKGVIASTRSWQEEETRERNNNLRDKVLL